MADLTITAANIITTSTATGSGTAGVTITAGQCVYLDSATNTLKLCTTASAALATCVGISLHASLAGQPLVYLKSGDLAFGAILTAGLTYCVSDTGGGIRPQSENGSGDWVTILGVATTTSNLSVSIRPALTTV